MKLVAPLCAPDEVESLVDAGADELYCGILEEWWRERYGDHDSVSRRQGRANLATRKQLTETVKRAMKMKIPVYLALNVRYTEPQLDYLTDLCFEFEEIGGTGVIVSDIGLLGRLKGMTNLRRCLSLLAVADNIPTIEAYRNLEVNRIVFPRFVTASEAGRLLEPFEGLEAETMAFFDKCPLVDGYCQHYHGVAWMDWAGLLDSQQPEPLYTFDTVFKTHACLGEQPRYLQSHPCAACHLPFYEAAGVEYAKIGGRGFPLEERVAALRFLRESVCLHDDGERADLYRQTFNRPCQCYYGDAAQHRDAIEERRPTADQTLCWLDYGELPPSAKHERLMVGSQTDPSTLEKLVLHWDWVNSLRTPFSIAIPPLDQKQMKELFFLLERLYNNSTLEVHLCLNDLGSLVFAIGFCKRLQANLESDPSREMNHEIPFTITIGSLLARIDDPDTLSHFLDVSENPSRVVCGADGKARVLTYAPPAPDLVRHWLTPSLLEPTACSVLTELLGGYPIIYEFARRR